MKLAIIDPHKLLTGFGKAWEIHKWIVHLIKESKPNFYLSNKAHLVYLPVFLKKTGLKWSDFNILYSEKSVRANSDILFYPWGYPTPKNLSTIQSILKGFNGMKVVHMQDFWFQAEDAVTFLDESGVEYLAGYSKHDEDSDFFCHYFPNYIGRVIPLPFGYSPELWHQTMDFKDRIPKIVGVGAIETKEFIDESGYGEDIKEYMEYFADDFTSMHPIRYELDNNQSEYHEIAENNFNVKGEPYTFIEDMNAYLNRYKLFINDQSLVHFPPAKTFEGCAAGAVMVAEDHRCFTDLGFRDGENCILFPKRDYKALKEKVSEFLKLSDQEQLDIQKNSLSFISGYRHDKIAVRFLNQLKDKFSA